MRANPFEGQLERLARTLTDQFGVQVVCQGDNASADGKPLTHRARRRRTPSGLAPRRWVKGPGPPTPVGTGESRTELLAITPHATFVPDWLKARSLQPTASAAHHPSPITHHYLRFPGTPAVFCT